MCILDTVLQVAKRIGVERKFKGNLPARRNDKAFLCLLFFQDVGKRAASLDCLD